jgi:hypothetical protein
LGKAHHFNHLNFLWVKFILQGGVVDWKRGSIPRRTFGSRTFGSSLPRLKALPLKKM